MTSRPVIAAARLMLRLLGGSGAGVLRGAARWYWRLGQVAMFLVTAAVGTFLISALQRAPLPEAAGAKRTTRRPRCSSSGSCS